MVKWWLLLVALVAGGAIGATAFRGPAHVEEQKNDTLKAESHEATVLDDRISLNVAKVIPGQTITKWKVVYRDGPDGGCAVASSEGEAVKTDPGSILISKNQETKRSDLKDLKLLDTHESLRIVDQAPRLTLGLGAEVQPLNGMSVKPAASLGFRFSKSLTIRGKVAVQPTDVKRSDVGLMLEMPL